MSHRLKINIVSCAITEYRDRRIKNDRGSYVTKGGE